MGWLLLGGAEQAQLGKLGAMVVFVDTRSSSVAVAHAGGQWVPGGDWWCS